MASLQVDPAMARFLAQHHLSDLALLMAQHRVSLEAARLMSDADFAEMGVPVGARRLILAKVRDYHDAGPSGAFHVSYSPPPRHAVPETPMRGTGRSPPQSDLLERLLRVAALHSGPSNHCGHCAGRSGYCACKQACPRVEASICFPKKDPQGNKRHLVHFTLDASELLSPLHWSRLSRLALRVVRLLAEVQPEAMVRFLATSSAIVDEIVDLPAGFINPGKLEKSLASVHRMGESDILKCLRALSTPIDDDLKKHEAMFASITHVFIGVDLDSLAHLENHRLLACVNVNKEGHWRTLMASPLNFVHPSVCVSHQEPIALRWLDGDKDETPMCTMCIDAPRETVLQPCGHCFGCGPCTHRALLSRIDGDVCPHCRTLVTEMLTLAEAEARKVKVYLPEY